MNPRSLGLLVTLLFITLSAAPRSARAEEEVNFDYFYGALQAEGDWFGTQQYGYVFQPRAAAASETWRPYADGYWSFTDEGWTWVSYEKFGWATYHYGRWAKLSNVGWVWIPGYEWAPAWVSWRSSPQYRDDAPEVGAIESNEEPESDYIGWAPLPPEAAFDAAVGFTSGVDDTYDIGPANYCFVPTRYFGAPVLVTVILAPVRNVFFIGRTVNVTNCSYAGVRGSPRIYCGGPQFANVYRRVERPIPRLTIERRAPAGVGPRNPAGPGALASMSQIRGNTLQVTAPRIVPPPGIASGAIGIPRNASPTRPANLKAEIARVDRVKGWDAPGLQPQAVQAAREQLKREAGQAPPRAAAPGATAPRNIARVPVSSAPVVSAAPQNPAAQTAPGAPSRPRQMVSPPDVTAANPARTPDVVAGERNLAEQQRRDVARQTQQGVMEQQRRAEAVRQQELQQQQAADLDRRQRLIAEQQRRGQDIQQQQREAVQRQNAIRQQQIDDQRRAQAEAQSRIQAQREQPGDQQRQAQAAAQAQRQQQLEAQRPAQADRQREVQAAAQARAQNQVEAARQQQAEAQRRAAEGARRPETPKGGQPTPSS